MTTIQDAFNNYQEGNRSDISVKNMRSTLKDLESAGFSADTPLSELNSEASIKRLQKWATTERFRGVSSGSGMFASRVKTLINSGKKVDEPNVLGNWEKLNRNSKNEFGIRLTRAARKLELPDFDSFNQAIDKTARQIPDKEARAFFLVKMLTGLRNPDIVNIQLGKSAKGAKYGSFDPAVQKIYALSNKGDRINYDLGEVVHGIFADLAENAQAEGRSTLFTQTEDQLRNKINPVMRKNMDAMGLEIFDLNKDKAVPFSIRDLRKNIFDILEEEEGAGAANKVLGHSSGGDVGLNHYKVERTRRKSLSSLQKSQELFSSLYMESIGFDNPQMVFGQDGYGFSSNKFKPSLVVTTGQAMPQQQQLAETRVRTAEGQVETTVDQTTDSLTKRINKLEGLIEKASTLQEQAQQLAPQKTVKAAMTQDDVDPAPNPEARDSLLKRGFDPKGMANALVDFMNKSGKAVVGAAAFETIRQFAEAPLETGAAIAKEIGLEAAARAAGLAMAPAAAIPMILEPSKITSSDLRPEDRPQDPAGPYAGQDFIPAPEVEQGTSRTDMARIATQDSGFIPEPSRVPEAAPARNEGFLSK